MIQELAGMLFVDGAWRRGEGAQIPVENPATGEVLGHIACATPAEIEEALSLLRDLMSACGADLVEEPTLGLAAE